MGDDVDVWQYELDLPELGETCQHVERVEGSAHIHECLTCDALSTITCEACEGLGLVPSQKLAPRPRPGVPATPAGLDKGLSIPKMPAGMPKMPAGMNTDSANKAVESYTKAMDNLVGGLFGKKS